MRKYHEGQKYKQNMIPTNDFFSQIVQSSEMDHNDCQEEVKND